jgi:general stress protein 26
MSVQGSVDHVWSLMEEIKIAMVITHENGGDQLRARPMAAHPAREENAIYFLTDAAAGKIGEVNHNDNVCLAFADVKGQKFVSVTGQASVSSDRDKIKQLWSIAEKAFWSDAADPAIRVLRVAPDDAEYWQSPGTVVSCVKMIVAGLTGDKPQLHDNERASLARPLRA